LTKPHPKRNSINIDNTLINSYNSKSKIKKGGSIKENAPILRLFINKDTNSEIEKLIYVKEYGEYILIDQAINSFPPKNSLIIR